MYDVQKLIDESNAAHEKIILARMDKFKISRDQAENEVHLLYLKMIPFALQRYNKILKGL